jgi:arginyl-tRNA synthetase
MMNHWVYDGFAATYQRMGISFDQTFYESNTYLLGKEMVDEGLEKGVFFRKEDKAVWADLSDDGLDEKLLLRSDGTSVYITQDLGTANQRYETFRPEKMIYVVGNEQNYHFDVLRFLLKKLGKEWWERVHHFSYGMVELPEGKMKSREGTVVDADELLQEMHDVAKSTTEELGKADSDNDAEMSDLYWTLALGALKFFILKVDPKKNMMFNPKESIDFNGNTGPFIQYTHARIKSLLAKAADRQLNQELPFISSYELAKGERNLLRFLYEFPDTVTQAANTLSPAVIANYVYELAREYNHFYQEMPVLREEDAATRYFRLSLSAMVAQVIRKAMSLLGIEVPERM